MREVVERTMATVALLLLFPVLAILCVLVKATSKGPVFFRAEMLGKDSKRFRIWKLRSLHSGCKAILSPDDKTLVLRGDPRLTPIGPLLRIGFDELPQLINIIKGEMSFVGPRPDPSWVLPRYTLLIRSRLLVKPGITGLSQVLGGRHHRQAAIYYLDHYYVRNRSLKLDMQTLLLTIPYLCGWYGPGKRILNGLLTRETNLEAYRLLPPFDSNR